MPRSNPQLGKSTTTGDRTMLLNDKKRPYGQSPYADDSLGGAQSCAAAGRQPEVTSALDDLARTIHRLGERSLHLQSRLNSVMRNEQVESNQKNLKELRPDVQLASGIRNMESELLATEAVIEDILRRLEI